MDYKEYYRPEHIQLMSDLALMRMFNKFERCHGVLVAMRFDGAQFTRPMNSKETLVKSLQYYNDNGKAFWYYTKDIKVEVNRRGLLDPEVVLQDLGGR